MTETQMLAEVRKDTLVPTRVLRLFGSCGTCDWRGTGYCSYGIESGTGNKNTSHPDNTCEERITFLHLISSKDKPSYKEWQKDYEQFKLQRQSSKENIELESSELEYKILKKRLDSILKELGDSEEGQNVKSLRQQVKSAYTRMQTARQSWRDTVGINLKYLSADNDRDAPKKIEVTERRTISLEDLHNIMRESEPKIVEGKVIKDSDERDTFGNVICRE